MSSKEKSTQLVQPLISSQQKSDLEEKKQEGYLSPYLPSSQIGESDRDSEAKKERLKSTLTLLNLHPDSLSRSSKMIRLPTLHMQKSQELENSKIVENSTTYSSEEEQDFPQCLIHESTAEIMLVNKKIQEIVSTSISQKFVLTFEGVTNIFCFWPSGRRRVLDQYNISDPLGSLFPIMGSKNQNSYSNLRCVEFQNKERCHVFCIETGGMQNLLCFQDLLEEANSAKVIYKTLCEDITIECFEVDYDQDSGSFKFLLMDSETLKEVTYENERVHTLRILRREQFTKPIILNSNQLIDASIPPMLVTLENKSQKLAPLGKSNMRVINGVLRTDNFYVFYSEPHQKGLKELLIISADFTRSFKFPQTLAANNLKAVELRSSVVIQADSLAYYELNTQTFALTKNYEPNDLDFQTSALTKHFLINIGFQAYQGEEKSSHIVCRITSIHLNYLLERRNMKLNQQKLGQQSFNLNQLWNQRSNELVREKLKKLINIKTLFSFQSKELVWEESKSSKSSLHFRLNDGAYYDCEIYTDGDSETSNLAILRSVSPTDGKTKALELWKGDSALIALDNPFSLYTNEGDLLNFLNNIVYLVPSKIRLIGGQHGQFTEIKTSQGRIIEVSRVKFKLNQSRLTETYYAIKTTPKVLIGSLGNCRLLKQSYLMVLLSRNGSSITVDTYNFKEYGFLSSMLNINPKFEFFKLDGSPYFFYLESTKNPKNLCFFNLELKTGQKIQITQHFQFMQDSHNIFFINQDREKCYALSSIPLAQQLVVNIDIEIEGRIYSLQKGATRILVIVPFLLYQGCPEEPVSTLSKLKDYVDKFTYYAARGLMTSRLFNCNKEEEAEEIENKGVIGLNAWDSLSQLQIDYLFENQSYFFHKNFQSINPSQLTIMILAEFTSATAVRVYFQSFFLSKLASFLGQSQSSSLLFIFESELPRLHQDAVIGKFSLKPFYDAAAINLRRKFFYTIQNSNPIESETADDQQFIEMIESEQIYNYKVEAFRSAFRFPVNCKHRSLKLMEAIDETTNLDIFEAPLMKNFIQQQWKHAYCFYLLESLSMAIGVVLLFIHSAFYRQFDLLIPVFVFQLWGLLVQVLECKSRKKHYLTEIENYLDLARIILFIVYFVLGMLHCFTEESMSTMLTIVNLGMTVKSLRISILIRDTRVQYSMIKQIIINIRYFLAFMGCVTLLTALLYTSAVQQSQLNNSTYVNRLFHSYLLDFGDFSTDEYSSVQVFVFIIGSLFMPLIMLNLLIAIMSGAYEEVLQDVERRDLKQLTALITKYYIVMDIMQRCCIRAKNRDKMVYVYFTQEIEKNEAQDDGWQTRMKELKSSVEADMAKQMREMEERLGLLEDKMESKLDQVSDMLKELNEKLD